MDERPTKRRGPLLWLVRKTWRFWISVALLPILYVASIPPIYWFGRTYDTPVGSLRYLVYYAYFSPVELIYQKSPAPVQEWLNWYVTILAD